MSACKTYIQQLLHVKEWMSIAEFMEIALHHKEYGYYSNQVAIGAQEDFVTAPEISQFFGDILGVWILNLWKELGFPKAFTLLECGPGKGTLMADILRIVSQRPQFIDGMSLSFVEINPFLKAQQVNLFSSFNPIWFEDTKTALKSLKKQPIFILANEFLDVLPIHQYTKKSTEWFERGLQLSASGKLEFALSKSRISLNNVSFPSSVPDESVLEVCPEALNLIEEIAHVLEKNSGGALFIDYGYSHGVGDTLQAVRQHQYSTLLDNPGTVDITAHVNFGHSLQLLKRFPSLYSSLSLQSEFLRQNGIELWADKVMSKASPTQQETLKKGLERLLDPKGMGTLFKVLEIKSLC